MKRGDIVQYMFDTGARGLTVLLGVVIKAGPKTFGVRWESAIVNTIRRSNIPRTLKLVTDAELLATAPPDLLALSTQLKGAA